MTKVSASTLARQAAKTKNPAHAKRLRAQAAKLRRDARKPRPAEKIMVGLNQALEHAQNSEYRPLDAPEQPGHGEIVGGYLSRKAEEITKIARKKGGVDSVQRELAELEAEIQDAAEFDAYQRERKAVQAVREEMRDKIVCGFIASVDMAEETKTMPMLWGVNSTTVASLVDALKANGYRADGKR